MKNRLTLGLLIAIGIVVLAAAAYYGMTMRTKTNYAPVLSGEASTGDWKTYRSREAAFEIKYPSSWFIKEEVSPEEVTVTWGPDNIESRSSAEDLVAGVGLRVTKGGLAEALDEVKISYTGREAELKISDIQFAGLPAKKVASTKYPHFYTMLVSSSGMIYRFSVGADSFLNSKRMDYSSVIDQILATFKFTL